MIKIRVPSPGIERRVEQELPKWKAEAVKRTSEDIAAGGNTDRSAELWSQIKPILKEVQLNKCAYCERFLGEDGRDWQVEHYRPKRGIKIWRWPGPPGFTDQAVPVRGGYHLLAHDIGNYLGSCGNCNNFKHNYFPVSAPRQLGTADRSILALERPLLVNPIDAEDDDPEELIEFYGPIPQARAGKGLLQLRALASIQVVNLMRQELVLGRCLVIQGIWPAYANRNLPGLRGKDARESLAIVTEPTYPYLGCVRSYLRLCRSNEKEAHFVYQMALGILGGKIRREDLEVIAGGTRRGREGVEAHPPKPPLSGE